MTLVLPHLLGRKIDQPGCIRVEKFLSIHIPSDLCLFIRIRPTCIPSENRREETKHAANFRN